MVIRESTSPFNELELSGTSDELRSIAHSLFTLRVGESCEFAADLSADPNPYERCLAKFEASASGGPTRVAVVGNNLRATGSPEMLGEFASFFDFQDDAKPGTHGHHEYLDEANIAPDSRPIVISVA